MESKMKIAIYCRVSTSEQTTDTQRHVLEQYAKGKGWKYKTFTEVESTRKTRPVKQQVLAALRSRLFGGVLVYKLDRWGRSLVELVTELRELTDKGIVFISLSDNIDFSTASGKLQFQILAAFSEFERSLISERTKDGLARKKAKGIVLGRKPGSKDKKPRKKSGYYVRHANKRPLNND